MFLFLSMILCVFTGIKSPGVLKIQAQFRLEIPEPSDLAFSEDGNFLFIVSDRGRLFKTDPEGRVLEKSKYRGADFEGVCVVGDAVYVVDETLRMILEFDADDLDLKARKQYTYHGAMNRGWESILFIEKQDRFLAFTEKLPVLIYAFDDDLDQKGVYNTEHISEVSGATYYDGYLWVVSDEDRTIYQVTPKSFKVRRSWRIPVLNPEGIQISGDGKIWVVSDAMQRIYIFNYPGS